MKIIKVFSQNVVLFDDSGKEKIAIGKGVGFNKKKNDLIFEKDIESVFFMQPEEQKKLLTLLHQINEEYILMAEEIINHAENVLQEKLSEHVLVVLTDHISFAANNIKNGIILKNKLNKEIETLYPEEFSIALWAVDLLNRTSDIMYSYDEVGMIALHIHSAKQSSHINRQESIREVSIISDIIDFLEKEANITIRSEDMSLSYTRFVSHLRLVLQRSQYNSYASLDGDIISIIKEKYSKSYAIAVRIGRILKEKYHITVSLEEISFITLHIERLLNASYR